MSELKWEFKWEDWMKPGRPDSFKYKILSGGPTPSGWVAIVEAHTETSSISLILDSKFSAEFDKRLFSWIRTWWDPKQRQQ